MNDVREALTKLSQALTKIERDLICAADGESVGGDRIKRAKLEGEALGVRKVINAFDGFIANLPPDPPRHPLDKDYMREAAKAIGDRLPDNHGFLLLTAPFGEDGRMFYVSSMVREDALSLLKEFLLKSGESEDWMKHIK
jgi:hypothetical protein